MKNLNKSRKNLGNLQFGGETLVEELGMSRANLHRKLKALTNHSAGSFIQAVRLKKAAQLIEQKFDTITQIAYLVGFNNPSYFSECFRRQFGCTPSEYQQH
jgi:AraC-like DNA-binding protein